MLRIVPPSVEVRQQPPGAFDPKYSDLLKPGGILVRSLYSLISTGTEMMKVSEAKLSLTRAYPGSVK